MSNEPKEQPTNAIDSNALLEAELKSAYKTLGRMAELNDKICSWISGQKEVPKHIAIASTEIMDYVDNVRP